MQRPPGKGQSLITNHHIMDNEQKSVADHLRQTLQVSAAFDFISAYFSINGYELLMDQLDSIDQVRFFFGFQVGIGGPRSRNAVLFSAGHAAHAAPAPRPSTMQQPVMSSMLLRTLSDVSSGMSDSSRASQVADAASAITLLMRSPRAGTGPSGSQTTVSRER